ncbi:hypothetical protein STAFG_6100 [Streptomyces afghaniensis 772]|uniref:Uncharacterized protein n=1 Tax=Streptomyces afghaniensis 772 TaxID=1283301 RepID=S4MJS3_9ACTN|nr:hypothetical protein STAFG_6100 [Streptomyces afghaniensis 772]
MAGQAGIHENKGSIAQLTNVGWAEITVHDFKVMEG